MQKTILISLPVEDFQSLIVDCVNSCLKYTPVNVVQQAESQEKLLTIQQAAEFLNLSVPTMYGKVSKRELPVIKRGKRLYFSSIQLMEYIKAGRKKSNAEIEEGANAYLLNNKTS